MKVTPDGPNFIILTGRRRVKATPGTPLHKMAADLLRLRKVQETLPPETKFPSYTLEQLERICQDGTATEEVRQEVARRTGREYKPLLNRNIP
jgi:hypothetical protein